MGVLWGTLYILTYYLWGSATSSGTLPVPLFLTVYGVSFLVGQMPAVFAVAAALWVIVAAVAVANGGKLSRGENTSAISVTHTL